MNSVEPRALTNNIRYCFPGDVSLEEAAHDQSDQSEMQLMSDGVTAAEIHQLTWNKSPSILYGRFKKGIS